MNTFDLLKEDHKKVLDLFHKFDESGGRTAEKRQIAGKIFQELEVHAKLEESLFYPAVKENAPRSGDGKELVNESVEEHRIVKRLIHELKKMDPKDEMFPAKFHVLKESVKHHIEEEEQQLFPEAKEILGDGEEELLAEIQEKKERLLKKGDL